MLNKKLEKYTIILASGSPRRQQFLRDLNLDFVIKTKSIDEIYPKYLHGSEITNYLSELKAAAFEGELSKDELLITADTIVRFRGKVLGKPKNADDAKNMLSELSGQAHEVISSISLTTLEKQKTFSETTLVYFKELTDEEINFYIDNYEPFDKAGAYGIQEWLGYIAVEKLVGSYFNVMGFPVHKFYK
ncbi:MAG: septum formation protein Maf, partial [Flavobacteriaceae bacterium]|nr:septum formation protein Maf [Flavobacteriaceae bacterium]